MAKVWKVKRIEYKTNGTNGTNEIDLVAFTITDTVDDVTCTRTDFHHIEPSSNGSFTKMEDVTEEQLLTWVKAKMGADTVAHHEKKLDDMIAAETTPPRGEKVFS